MLPGIDGVLDCTAAAPSSVVALALLWAGSRWPRSSSPFNTPATAIFGSSRAPCGCSIVSNPPYILWRRLVLKSPADMPLLHLGAERTAHYCFIFKCESGSSIPPVLLILPVLYRVKLQGERPACPTAIVLTDSVCSL
eukprot:6198461-Pleurochrysis_carterae.AAC.4